MPNESEKLRRNTPYPLDQGDKVRARLPPDAVAIWTGERRPPRKGEWYLSGAIIGAYMAPNDLSSPHAIATLTYSVKPTLTARETALIFGALTDLFEFLHADMTERLRDEYRDVTALKERFAGLARNPADPRPWRGRASYHPERRGEMPRLSAVPPKR
jgi:hypothetical protein